MIALLLLLALAQVPSEEQPALTCPFSRPPRCPSFTFCEIDDEAVKQLTMTRNGVRVVEIPEGAIVLGSVATSMPGGTVIRAWTFTREDKSVSSYVLHGDALARLYADVILWLKEHPRPSPIDESAPRTKVD